MNPLLWDSLSLHILIQKIRIINLALEELLDLSEIMYVKSWDKMSDTSKLLPKGENRRVPGLSGRTHAYRRHQVPPPASGPLLREKEKVDRAEEA